MAGILVAHPRIWIARLFLAIVRPRKREIGKFFFRFVRKSRINHHNQHSEISPPARLVQTWRLPLGCLILRYTSSKIKRLFVPLIPPYWNIVFIVFPFLRFDVRKRVQPTKWSKEMGRGLRRPLPNSILSSRYNGNRQRSDTSIFFIATRFQTGGA